MSQEILTLSGVSKAFTTHDRRITALDSVSFALKSGQVTGLIGPDAAGKTTLMRLIAGLLLPDSGHIEAMGMDVINTPLAVQSQLGYMPQRFGLYEDLTVQENLDLYANLQGVPLGDRQERYAQLMHMTGMAPFTGRLAGKLSGGMKQKLGLACSLLRSPRLLLLDEPTVGVDPVSRRELWEIVYRQVSEQGMSVLLSTAYLDEAERCGEVVLLHEGQVLMQGEPKSFSQSVAGRIFQVSVKNLRHRSLQQQLSRASGVLDALIEGEGVRLVMHEAGMPDVADLLPELNRDRPGDIMLQALPARFEDAFMARLKTQTTPVFQTGTVAVARRDGTQDEVIRVENLTRRFGDFIAVDNISFQVMRGEIFGLLGANGAGKSTAFRMLCGLLPVSQGTASVSGHDLRIATASVRRQLGYMAQKFSLYTDLSVVQNLRFFSSAYGLRGRLQKQRINWALSTFELQDYQNSNAGDLPLGYKQRLSFAVALMHEPDILFLDEPTSGVDPLARREFWERTNSLAESGVTILVTTHFMEEANYCDRLVIMADGKILAAGTPLQMKALARSAALPDPTMEDAFIQLIQKKSSGSHQRAQNNSAAAT